jgi:hypothetical protein
VTFQDVSFDGTWYDHDAQPARGRDSQGEPTGAIAGDYWTTIYQRAILQQRGVNWRDANTMEDWSAHLGDSHFTIFGNEDSDGTGIFNKSFSTSTAVEIQSWLQRGEVVTASTPSALMLRADGIIPSHAYAVVSINMDASGNWRIQLYNPWGVDNDLMPISGPNDGLIDISWDTFALYFDEVCHSTPSRPWAGWVQIGSDWNQFTHIFMGTDGWIYAKRSDGALLKNLYRDNGPWAGWVQIGSDWNQFTHIFMGTDEWIYAKRSDGALLKNLFQN